MSWVWNQRRGGRGGKDGESGAGRGRRRRREKLIGGGRFETISPGAYMLLCRILLGPLRLSGHNFFNLRWYSDPAKCAELRYPTVSKEPG